MAHGRHSIVTTDILELLKLDPGTRTLGQLLQERQWAAMEIERLRAADARMAAAAVAEPPAQAHLRARTAMRSPALADSAVLRKPAETAAPVAVQAMPPRLLRLRDVQDMVGLSRSTIYQMIARGRFPAGMRVGERARRWPIAEVVAWQEALAR